MGDLLCQSQAWRGGSVLQLQGIEFWQQREWTWKRNLSRDSRSELSLATTLISALWYPEQRTQPCHIHTSDLHNQELINRHCFKPQVCENLLHGNTCPQIYVNNLYSSLIVFHPGLRLRCSRTLRKAWEFWPELFKTCRVISNVNLYVYFLRMYLSWLWSFLV